MDEVRSSSWTYVDRIMGAESYYKYDGENRQRRKKETRWVADAMVPPAQMPRGNNKKED